MIKPASSHLHPQETFIKTWSYTPIVRFVSSELDDASYTYTAVVQTQDGETTVSNGNDALLQLIDPEYVTTPIDYVGVHA